MKKLFASFLLVLLLTTQIKPAYAVVKDFELYMKDWNDKRELATQYLLEAEEAFKEGDEAIGCVIQRKASKYGIEATQSLIIAMKLNGSDQGVENFEYGLNKWKELGDFC